MYSLCGILSKNMSIPVNTSIFGEEKIQIIPLKKGISLIPFPPEFIKCLNKKYGMNIDEYEADFEDFPKDVENWILALSQGDGVAYVVATSFGGEGWQHGTFLKNGKEIPVVCNDNGYINSVLRLLGVEKEGGMDEFDTIGLGRCRRTSDWRL